MRLFLIFYIKLKPNTPSPPTCMPTNNPEQRMGLKGMQALQIPSEEKKQE